MNKNELRKIYLKKLSSLSIKEKALAAEKAYTFLKSALEKYPLVASFYPLQSEIDLSPLNTLLAQEQRLALPRVEGHSIAFYKVRDLTKETQKAPHGVFEPLPNPSLKVQRQELSLLLVPGLAFDRLHYRLGRGGGYYDRVLAAADCPHSWAIAYNLQRVDFLLPREQHDQAVERVLYF